MTTVLLEKLEKLTEILPSLTGQIINTHPGFTEYDATEGTSLVWGLLKEKCIAVQMSFISKGSLFRSHVHQGNEYMIVYKGALQFTIDDDQRSITYPGQCQFIPSGQRHECEALEDTWMVGITVPADAGYPDVR